MKVVISEDLVKELDAIKSKRDKNVRWLRYLCDFRFWFTVALLIYTAVIFPYRIYIKDYIDKVSIITRLLLLGVSCILMVLSDSLRGLKASKEFKTLEKNGYDLKSLTYYSSSKDSFSFLGSNAPASMLMHDNYKEYEELYNSISAVRKLVGKELLGIEKINLSAYYMTVKIKNGLDTESVILTASKIKVIHSKKEKDFTFELNNNQVLTVIVPKKGGHLVCK